MQSNKVELTRNHRLNGDIHPEIPEYKANGLTDVGNDGVHN